MQETWIPYSSVSNRSWVFEVLSSRAYAERSNAFSSHVAEEGYKNHDLGVSVRALRYSSSSEVALWLYCLYYDTVKKLLVRL